MSVVKKLRPLKQRRAIWRRARKAFEAALFDGRLPANPIRGSNDVWSDGKVLKGIGIATTHRIRPVKRDGYVMMLMARCGSSDFHLSHDVRQIDRLYCRECKAREIKQDGRRRIGHATACSNKVQP